MGARSKQKGSAFERDVCKRLSLWVTAGERQDVFWRSAMSGGRATMRNRSNAVIPCHKGIKCNWPACKPDCDGRPGRSVGNIVRQAGDITAVAAEGHYLTDNYYIECKHIRDLAIGSFFIGRAGPLWQFWQQTIRQAAFYHQRPWLIAKQNNVPTLIIMNEDVLAGRMKKFSYTTYIVKHDEPRSSIYIYQFNELLDRFSYAETFHMESPNGHSEVQPRQSLVRRTVARRV